MKIRKLLNYAWLLLFVAAPMLLRAQTTVTVNCTGGANSFKSGSVTSGGVINDGSMTVSNGTGVPRGWAVFNLSSLGIPANATITAASIVFNKITVTGNNAVACALYVVGSDVSTLASTAQGSTLYTTLLGTSVSGTAWGNSSGLTSALAFNAAGITALQNNMNSIVSIGFSNTGNRVFTLTGYNGTAATQPQLSITYVLPCSGQPVSGTASAGASTCPNVSFTLSSSGASSGSGITYQWEKFNITTSLWDAISGATNTSYTVSAGITVASSYHLVVTCTNGNLSATTNAVNVTVNPAYSCFCASTTTNTSDEYVSNVASGSFTNPTGRTNYGSYSSLGAINTVQAGASFTIDVTVNGAYDADAVFVYLDYNQNGTLIQGELIGATNFGGIGSAVTGTRTVNCTVPITALSGLTGLRIKAGDTANTTKMSRNPCQASYTYGEVEDYVLNVTAANICAGLPAHVTLNGPTAVCTGNTFTLTAPGATVGVGIVYQWEKYNTATSAWDPISGASTASYTATGGIAIASDYRFTTTCTNPGGGVDISNTISISINAPTQCYCTPIYTVGCYDFGDIIDINDFSVLGENGSAITQSATGCTTGGYANYSALTPVQLLPGSSYTASMTSSMYYGLDGTIWIDFNDDGSFSASEIVSTIPTTSALTFSANIAMPPVATQGVHRMRVRGTYDGVAVTSACNSYDYGETHDYSVLVLPPPACIANSALTASNITPTSADLGWTNNSTATQFRVEYGPLGFTPGTGTFALATSNPFTINGLTSATSYSFYVRALCSATDSSTQTGPYNFFTPCPASNIPYIENFDGVVAPSIPGCLSVQDVNTDGSTWTTSIDNASTAPNSMTYTYNVSNAANDWFFSQGLNMTAGTAYIVSFKYASDGFFAEKLEVKNGTSPIASAMGTALFSNTNILNSTFNTATFYYTPSVSGVQYFGWHCFSVADQDELFVDDISVDLAPTCLPATALTASSVTPSSANLGWTSTATQIRIEYGPSGFTPGTGTFVLANSNPYTLSGLTAGTAYSFYARALCSATDSSTQAGPFNFSTPCLGTNVPYSENFDGAVVPASPSCIIVENVNNDASAWHTSTTSSASAPNAMMYGYNTNNAANDWFYVQGLNMTAGVAYQVSFNYAVQSSTFPEKLEVKVGTSPSASAMTGAALFSNNNLVNTTFSNNTFFYTPATSGTYYFGWHCFSAADQDNLFVDDISINLGPTCPSPTTLTTTSVMPTSANLGWTNASSATQFRIEYGPTGFTPGTGTFVLATTNPYTLSGLSASTAYQFYVRALCSATDSSSQSGPASFTTLITNDVPAGATTLTLGAGCTGAPYTNAGSTNSTGEPFPSCRGTAGFHSVWFKFVAPASGFVRVTNDYSGALIGNSRIAVFSTSDPNTFSSFSILACDDNNGSVVANKSLLYVNGLTPTVTYYVEVDGVNNGAVQDVFCITVDEVNSSMVATTAACAAGHAQANKNTAYTGWISLVDASGKLIANVRQTNSATTSPTAYASAVNVNTGGVRQNNGLYYLDRNYLISATGTNATQFFDVQFYFLNSELTALQGVDAAAVVSGLNVTRQANNTCQANFATANGARSILVQSGNNTVGGVTSLQVVTPGFSNFYVHAGIVPLAIKLESISAVNVGTRNRVDWSTATEDNGDAFIVQRSIDGTNFTDIGTVKAYGKASAYSFWDERPIAGVNHYRLKLTNATGTSAYSSTVHVTVAATGTFTVEAYPNPVKDMVTIKMFGTPGNDPHLVITDVTGKVVANSTFNNESINIDLSRLANGFYLLKYTDGSHSQTIKLNKE